nr:hypothetical protein [Raoultella ornithinolytica]UGK55305.1 Hypothetical protein [Raoultella ornithinolytica]UUW42103.1 hypothetical protein [Klebsiella michiganensis]
MKAIKYDVLYFILFLPMKTCDYGSISIPSSGLRRKGTGFK